MDSKLRWVPDPSADLGRINRQQVFLQHVIDQAGAKTKGFDLKRMNDLLSSTADNLKVDTGLDLGQMVKLARKFRDFHGDQLRTHTLPVYPYETAGGASVLKLDHTAAAPVFDVFRGVAPGDAVPPPDIRLAIENGSGVSGQAGEAQQAFESIGFSVERTSTATATQTATVVRYAPGSEVVAQSVADHLSPVAQLQEDATLAADQVLVVTGKDFKGVTDNGQTGRRHPGRRRRPSRRPRRSRRSSSTPSRWASCPRATERADARRLQPLTYENFSHTLPVADAHDVDTADVAVAPVVAPRADRTVAARERDPRS